MCETGSHSSFATTRLPASHNTTCGGPHFFRHHGFQVWLTFCGVEPLYHRQFPSASSATEQCQICRKHMLKNLDRIVLFPFQDHDGLDLHIGISPLGLTVYHNRCKINFFPWYVNIFLHLKNNHCVWLRNHAVVSNFMFNDSLPHKSNSVLVFNLQVKSCQGLLQKEKIFCSD